MKEYTYSVARVRAKETALLTRQDIDQLLSADGYTAALRLVRDRGYRAQDNEGADDAIAAAEKELWEFITEIADKDTIRILRLPVDYHNVKAAVKSVFSGMDGHDLLLDNGTVDKDVIYSCVKRREYYDMENPTLERVCEEAMTLILRTQDGQACDIYIDNAMLSAVEDAARESGDMFLKRYADLLCDTANLKAAYRCAASGRGEAFIENALYPGGTLNIKELIAVSRDGINALCEYVAKTRYGAMADSMKTGAAALEKKCADEIMRLMDEAKFDSFTSAPIIAYYYAKRTEIDAVRLILSGKLNRLDDNMIRERVPRTYV